MDYGEAQQLFEGVVIAVSMQQRMCVTEAEGCDQAVDRFAYGTPSRAQMLEILRGFDGYLLAASFKQLKLPKLTQDSGKRFPVPDALKSKESGP